MTADDVVAIHTAFNRALVAHDVDTLARIYGDDYMLVRPDGSVLSKQDVLRDLETGGLMFKSIEIGNIDVRVYGGTALLTGESRTVTSRKSQDTTAHVRLLAVYVAEAGGLRLAHFQSVSMPT